jgi:homoserine kinase
MQDYHAAALIAALKEQPERRAGELRRDNLVGAKRMSLAAVAIAVVARAVAMDRRRPGSEGFR